MLVAAGRGFTPWSRDGVEALRAAGARVRRLDLIDDEALPEEAAGLVIAGHLWPDTLGELAQNFALMRDLRVRVADGLPTLALGGGALYFLKRLQDAAGRSHDLAGILPGSGEMIGELDEAGYLEVRAERDSVLLRAGETVDGLGGRRRRDPGVAGVAQLPPERERARLAAAATRGGGDAATCSARGCSSTWRRSRWRPHGSSPPARGSRSRRVWAADVPHARLRGGGQPRRGSSKMRPSIRAISLTVASSRISSPKRSCSTTMVAVEGHADDVLHDPFGGLVGAPLASR